MYDFIEKCKIKIDTSINEVQEIENYLKTITVETDAVTILKEFKDSLLNNNISRNIPICMPVYEFNSKNCSGLVKLLKESTMHNLNRKYFIFVNESKYKSCEFINEFENFNVISVPDEYNSLALKRIFIFDYCKNENFKNIFVLDSDVHTFGLPVKIKVDRTDKPSYEKNKAYNISSNLAFDIWEYLINKYDLKLSAFSNNLKFTWSNNFIMKNTSVIQCIHFNIENCCKNNIYYDKNSGWEDYDFQLQFLVNGIDTHVINIQYLTPTMYSNSTFLENNINRYNECSEKLYNKWGDKYVKKVITHGFNNCRIKFKQFNKIINTYDECDW